MVAVGFVQVWTTRLPIPEHEHAKAPADVTKTRMMLEKLAGH
jgi:hypothetical protein